MPSEPPRLDPNGSLGRPVGPVQLALSIARLEPTRPLPDLDHGLPADQRARDADQLAALIEAGGFWRLAQEWVPRTGHATPTRQVVKDVEAGLLQMSADDHPASEEEVNTPTEGVFL